MSHMTVAVSERGVKKLFETARDKFSFSDSGSGSFSGFSASYSVAFKLQDGTVDLRDDNTIKVSELDIKWTTLQVGLGFDIPEICIGGWCIPMPWPIPDICLPKICVFSDNPDIAISLDLSSIITSEISLTASPVIKYTVDPGRTPVMTDLDAEDAGVPNKWRLFIDPITVDIDLFDVADIVGDLLENAVKNVVDGLLGWLPGWAKDLILAILGPIIDLIRAILDIPDDIGEWLSDLLGVSLGFFNFIVNAVAGYFAAKNALYEFEDPFPIEFVDSLPFSPPIPLIPVKIPIRDLSVNINDVEMVLEANVGV
jgi:hypothetical protein